MRFPTERPSAVAAAADETGVAIAAVSATYNMIHPDPAVRAARACAASASSRPRRAPMGTRLLTLCTGTRDPDDQWRAHPDNDTPEAWRDLLASMEAAVAIAERYDVDLGIEPELANVVNSAARARRLIDEIAKPAPQDRARPRQSFRDASRPRNSAASSPMRSISSADRIVMAHAKDRDPDGQFATAGKGVLDYPHYLALPEVRRASTAR